MTCRRQSLSCDWIWQFGNRQPDGLAFNCRTNGGMLQMKLEVAQRMFSLMELSSILEPSAGGRWRKPPIWTLSLQSSWQSVEWICYYGHIILHIIVFCLSSNKEQQGWCYRIWLKTVKNCPRELVEFQVTKAQLSDYKLGWNWHVALPLTECIDTCLRLLQFWSSTRETSSSLIIKKLLVLTV